MELSLKNGAFLKGLKNSGERLKDFGKGMALVGAAFSAAGAAIVSPFIIAVKHFADFGSQLNDMRTRTGISAAALAQFGYAAEQTGAQLEDVEIGVRKMQKFLGTSAVGSKEARKSIRDLGLAWSDIKSKSPEAQFEAIANKIGAIADPSKRAAAAIEIFGKKGTSLLPMIAELAVLKKEAIALGIAPSDAAVKAADDLGDSFHRIVRAAGAASFEIGAALAPSILGATQVITRIIVSANKWAKANTGLVTTVAAVGGGLLAVGAVITGVGVSIAVMGFALSGFAKATRLVSGAFTAISTVVSLVASPLGLIAFALTSGVALWATYTQSGKRAVNSLMGFLGPLLTLFQSTFSGIKDAITAGDLGLAGQIAMASLKVGLMQGVASIATGVGGAFGDFIGKVGTQLADGDLTAVWSTVTDGMTSIWAGFSEGLVSVFTEATKKIADLWQGMQDTITNSILESAAKGGWGKFLVDDIKDADEIITSGGLMEGITTAINAPFEALGGKKGPKIGAGTDLQGVEAKRKKLDQRIREQHPDTPTGPSALDEAKQAAKSQTAKETNALRSKADQVAADAQKRTQDAMSALKKKTFGGAAGSQSTADSSQAELDALTEKARKAREAKEKEDADAKSKIKNGAEGAEAQTLKDNVVGTFSAAGLAAAGAGGGSTADRTAKATEGTYDEMKQQRKLMYELSRVNAKVLYELQQGGKIS